MARWGKGWPYMAEMTWEEVAEFLREHDVVVVPVGSCEQHGPHLPLDTDTYDALWVSLRAAEKAGCALVAPPITYGVSYHHMAYPGTVSISPETLMRLAIEVAESLIKHGFKKIVFENGHGGNSPALNAAAQVIRARHPDVLVVVDTVGLIPDLIEELVETPYDAHSGEFETSTSLANRPELVRRERIRKPDFREPSVSYMRIGLKAKGPRVFWPIRTDELSDTGAIGDPTKASEVKGRELLKAMVDRLADLLMELRLAKP
ncbi:MAG TPA: creatininase family protein [Candidatus Bathyarchaeota archaeon]|nr:creatininase family protein [Candidatus Bathyarchaeota archaeon]